MSRSTLLTGSLVVGLFLSGVGFAQGGFSGSGRGSIGGITVGGSFGRNNDIDGSENRQAFDPAVEMPGNWLIEFLVDEDSTDPKARGDAKILLASVTLDGNRVIGRIDDRGIQGEFECTISFSGRCLRGRLRFSTDTVDWQEFAFEIDESDYSRGEGWGIFVDEAAGVRREYELILEKWR